jgi:Leucine-rich repeat (LRR) protein
MIQVAENSLTNIQFPEKMPNLSSLYLGRNKLTQIQLPQDLGQLTSLSLARNQLSSWRCPEALFNARTISLGGNPLQSLEIPKGMRLEIFELSQINQNIIQFYGSSKTPTKIDVPDPGLDKAIRRALDQPVGMLDEIDLERLVMLDATMDVRQGIQPIRNLQGLENAVNLEELNLETFGNVNIVECDLTPLTDLKWFRHLNLGNNQLRTIRIPGIMSQIKTFIGHGNPFTDFTFLSSMPNLKSLYLSASNLKDVHTGSIAELLALERLDLAGNQISDIGFLDALINLRVLSLAHNPLENGNLSFSNLSSDLKRLYLNDCGLKSVHFPDTPTSLRYLSLKSNELTVLRLPESMSQLKTLDLSNNNIKTLILPKHTSQMRNILLNGNPIQLLQASDSTNFREIQFTSISDDCKVKLVPSGRNYNFGDVKNFGPPLQTAVGDDSPAWPKASKEGLIGWYLFQRGANDLSGQGNDGQMHEVVPIEDRFGNMTSAFWFNGKTSYIEIPSMSQRSFVNKTYTFSFWATPRRLPAGTNLGAVISKWESEPKPNKDLLELQTFRINLRVIGGDSTSFKGLGFSMSGHQGVGFGGETPPYNRAWDHHVVVCDFKDGVIRTYINGDLSIDTKAQKIRLNVNQQDNATPFILGHIAGQRAEGEGYYGGLDDVRIFDRALTAEEVKSLYELEKIDPNEIR